MKAVDEDREGDVGHSEWADTKNAEEVYKAAKKYAEKVGNYFKPSNESNKSKIEWRKKGNRFIIGPLKFKFADELNGKSLSNGGTYGSDWYFCDEDGTKKKNIESN